MAVRSGPRRWSCAILVALSCLLGDARPRAAPLPGCLLGFAAAAPAPPVPGLSAVGPLPAVAAKPCHNGRDVVDFAWRLIGYGKATLQYLVGILLLMLGGVFLVLGFLIELVEALFC